MVVVMWYSMKRIVLLELENYYSKPFASKISIQHHPQPAKDRMSASGHQRRLLAPAEFLFWLYIGKNYHLKIG